MQIPKEIQTHGQADSCSVLTYSVRDIQYISFFKVQLIRLRKQTRETKNVVRGGICRSFFQCFCRSADPKVFHSPVLPVIQFGTVILIDLRSPVNSYQ